jgi:hypothetical protein
VFVGSFEIGAVLPLMQFGPERTTARWPDIREMAQADLMIGPGTIEAFEAMAPVLELLRRDRDAGRA